MAAAPHTLSLATLALSLAAFGSAMSARVSDPLLPLLSESFHLPVGSVSWVITCFTISYALCQLGFGPIGDRFGKYRVIAWASAGSGVASLLCAAAPSFFTLVLARALVAGMIAAVIPLAMAWIGDVVPYERRQATLARFLIGQILGVSAGQLLGGLSADYFGWRLPFVVIGVLLLLAALFQFAMYRRLPASARTTRSSEGRSDDQVVRHLLREIKAVLSRPWARVVLATVSLEGAAVFGAFAFFPLHLHRTLDVSLTTAGSIVMFFGFGGFAFATGAQRLVPWLGEAGLARQGALIMLAAMLAVAFAPSLWITAPACLAMGLGFYMLHNTLQTHATQMAPERRGAAVSVFAMSYFLGQSTGLALCGWLVERVSTRTIIACAAVGVMGVGLSFARNLRQRRA